MPMSLEYMSPTSSFVAVTPSDTAEVKAGKKFKSLYIGTTGNVAVPNVDGTSVVHVGVPAGAILYVVGEKVLSTGTTASNIVAYF